MSTATSFEALRQAIKDEVLSFEFASAVTPEVGELKIAFHTPSNGGEVRICLQQTAGVKKYFLSQRQLAGLRIVKQGQTLKSKTMDEWDNSAEGEVLQDLLIREIEANPEYIRLICVGTVGFKNDQVVGEVIYRDRCYAGYEIFTKNMDALKVQYPTSLSRRSPEYFNATKAVRDTLHKSGYAPDFASDDLRKGLESTAPIYEVVRFK